MLELAWGEAIMIVDKLEVGPLGVNCYLVGDEASHAGMIIDPGADAAAILYKAKGLGLNIRSIVITHAHFDHIGGLKEVKAATKAPVAVGVDDAPSLRQKDPISAAFGFSYPAPPAPDRLLRDGDIIEIGSLTFRVLHTPGHTPGGICLVGEKVVFTGDTLFYSGIGRTDLTGGNPVEIIESIRTKLMALPDDTVVYPGHGPETTIRQEKAGNPFL
jgi:hydroxyacylglutathione hydrolase